MGMNRNGKQARHHRLNLRSAARTLSGSVTEIRIVQDQDIHGRGGTYDQQGEQDYGPSHPRSAGECRDELQGSAPSSAIHPADFTLGKLP